MEIISLSKKRFKSLVPLDLPKEILNTEAKIFDFRYKGRDKVFKKLYQNSGPIFANKLYTVEMLDYQKDYLSDCFLMPDYLVTVGGVAEGFTIPKIKGVTLSILLNDKKIDLYILFKKSRGNVKTVKIY